MLSEQPEGQNRESSQPTRDSLEGLSEDELRAELERRQENTNG
jgi:hypothetical protein